MQQVLSLHFWWLGIPSFLVMQGLHIILWRITPVRRHLFLLISLFFGGGSLPFLSLGLSHILSCSQLALPLMTHFVLSAHYISIYPAFQASSPTMDILYFISCYPDGVSLDKLCGALEPMAIIEQRFSDLECGKLIRREKEKNTLTLRGKLLAELFIQYRKCLGLSAGEG